MNRNTSSAKILYQSISFLYPAFPTDNYGMPHPRLFSYNTRQSSPDLNLCSVLYLDLLIPYFAVQDLSAKNVRVTAFTSSYFFDFSFFVSQPPAKAEIVNNRTNKSHPEFYFRFFPHFFLSFFRNFTIILSELASL